MGVLLTGNKGEVDIGQATNCLCYVATGYTIILMKNNRLNLEIAAVGPLTQH